MKTRRFRLWGTWLLTVVVVVGCGAARPNTGAPQPAAGTVPGPVPAPAATAGGVTDEMWVILDPGHGWTYGSDAPNGRWTGFEANGRIEDVETVRLMTAVQTEIGRRPEHAHLPTALLRTAPEQGDHAERNVADWDGDRQAWLDPPPRSATPNLQPTVEANKTRANYDRVAFANSRPTGTHDPGKIYFALHLDERPVTDSMRGTVVFLPCYGRTPAGIRDARLPPDCPANVRQSAESRRLAHQICQHLRAIPGWPACRLGTWREDFTVLREISERTPGVLVELINLADPRDAALLEPAVTDEVARALAAAIAEFYAGPPVAP